MVTPSRLHSFVRHLFSALFQQPIPQCTRYKYCEKTIGTTLGTFDASSRINFSPLTTRRYNFPSDTTNENYAISRCSRICHQRRTDRSQLSPTQSQSFFFLIWRPRRIFHPRELVIFEPCFVRYLNTHAYTLTRLQFFRTYFLINSGASTFLPSQHYSNLFLTHIFFNQISNNFLLDQLLLRASNSSRITDVDNSSSVFHPTLENIPIRAKSN